MDIRDLLGSFYDVISWEGRVMSEFEPVGPATAVEYNHTKPALLFGSSPRRRARAESALAGSGVRLVDSVSLDQAGDRLDGQLSLGLAWLELGEEDATPALDSLLSRLCSSSWRHPPATLCAAISRKWGSRPLSELRICREGSVCPIYRT